MANKYLEKIAGFSMSGAKAAVGKFAKNLTGETVRETKKAVDLHNNISSNFKAQAGAVKSEIDEIKSTRFNMHGSKRMSNALNEDRHYTAGMDNIKQTVKDHIPHKTDADLAKALKDRKVARIGTAGAVAAVGGGVAANNLSKKAGLNLSPITRRVLSTAGAGAAAGGVLGAASADKGKKLQGGFGGAIAGGALGALGGSMMVKNKANQASAAIGKALPGANGQASTLVARSKNLNVTNIN